MATNAPEEQSGFRPGANPGPAPGRLVAISIKQPWAALLVAGVKTVEVRTWWTARRGRVLIHAAKVPDDRPEGWALVTTPELRELAALRGGMIGVGDLIDCVRYPTQEAFAAAAAGHRNAPEWFRPAGLHGFVFQNLRPIMYHACPGKTMFFTVNAITLA
ncbi:ASCH domain-containing protein [Gemmata sp.]|uniref:ASCH domain-containing protein n=1 Tax=Gemmata sp. TaxID=1914242 RepID=UPI003F6FE304